MYSIFVPHFSPTDERTKDGRIIYAVSMQERRAPAATLGQAMQYAKDHGIGAPVVGPRSARMA